MRGVQSVLSSTRLAGTMLLWKFEAVPRQRAVRAGTPLSLCCVITHMPGLHFDCNVGQLLVSCQQRFALRGSTHLMIACKMAGMHVAFGR